MHLTEPVFFSHPFQSGTASEKGGLQLLGPRLTPGRAQLKKMLSGGDELAVFVSDANVHRRLLQRWVQLSAQCVSGDLGVTGTTGWSC